MDEIGEYTEKGIAVQIRRRAVDVPYRWKLKYDTTICLPSSFTGGGWNEPS